MELEDIQRIRQEHMRLFAVGQHLPKELISGASKSSNMDSHTVDYTDDAVAVRALAAKMSSLRCSGCGHRIEIETANIIRIFKDDADEFYGSCIDCGATTCLGCRKVLTTATERLGNTTSDDGHFMWHCDGARLALIWALLSGYDDQMNHDKLSTSPRNRSSKKPATLRPGIAGIGYSPSYELDDWTVSGNVPSNTASQLEAQEGMGFIGSIDYDEAVATMAARVYKAPPSTIRIDPHDEPTAKVMAAMAAILPAPKTQAIPTEFDLNPPEALASMIERSSILDKAAELLRNNSLEDATKRFRLYDSLFGFVRALATGGTMTMGLLHKPRTINKAGHNLLKVAFGLPTRLHNESVETSQSLFHCATDLIKQSEKLLQNAAVHQLEFQTEDAQRMLMLCTNIKDCAELCNQFVASNSDHQRTDSPQDPDAWQDGIQVLAVPDEDIFNHYHYAKEARSFISAPRGRIAKLIKEISMLEGGLGRNIFVRYGESRMDVMKAVIVGPQGTPYEHGFFEFDLLFPLDYPQKSPQMYFRTTGGGSVLFNPNLYANGKVCLSLLGTWQGEQWEPGKSTLLQVLHSIQAMIFCEEPWCNEPGRESMHKTEASKRFNRTLYESTVKYAMLEWIQGKKSSPPPPRRKRSMDWDGSSYNYAKPAVPSYQLPETTSNVDVFADVAKKYFERNRGDVVKTVRAWVEEKKGKGADLLPGDGPLEEYLTAALQHLRGPAVGYDMATAGLVGPSPWS